MFRVPTVLVLGAGAGDDIGMPVGSTLKHLVARKLNIKHDSTGALKSGDLEIAQILRRDHRDEYNDWRASGCKVAEGIEYAHSIDDYLQTHHGDEKIEECAKLAIVQTILEHERGCALYLKEGAHRDWHFPDKVRDSWLPIFFRMLQQGVSAQDGARHIFRNLCVINFNYDRCFEHFICRALRLLYQMEENQAHELMKSLKVFHPYGVVGQPPWREGRVVRFGEEYEDLIGASKEIRTFNEKIEEGTELQDMREEISKAIRIVFLGFHFHPQNMELLRSVPPARGGDVIDVYATALGRSQADKEVIDHRIREMLSARGGSWRPFVERDTNCNTLLTDYGATLLS